MGTGTPWPLVLATTSTRVYALVCVSTRKLPAMVSDVLCFLLPLRVRSYVGICTAEGDNYLLTLQTARYLVKSLQKAQVCCSCMCGYVGGSREKVTV